MVLLYWALASYGLFNHGWGETGAVGVLSCWLVLGGVSAAGAVVVLRGFRAAQLVSSTLILAISGAIAGAIVAGSSIPHSRLAREFGRLGLPANITLYPSPTDGNDGNGFCFDVCNSVTRTYRGVGSEAALRTEIADALVKIGYSSVANQPPDEYSPGGVEARRGRRVEIGVSVQQPAECINPDFPPPPPCRPDASPQYDIEITVSASY